MEAVDPAPEKRIGDRERREVDARLQQAHGDGVLMLTEYDERSAQCWAARTRSELDVLVRDLPDPVAPPAPAPAPVPMPAPQAYRVRRRHGVIGAVVLAVALAGGVQAAYAPDGSTVFGHRVVQLTADQDAVDVGVLFGNAEVVVPDDARVSTGGTILFGDTDCDGACDGTGTRAVTVEARGAFGSVDVVRQGERAARDADRDRDRDRDD